MGKKNLNLTFLIYLSVTFFLVLTILENSFASVNLNIGSNVNSNVQVNQNLQIGGNQDQNEQGGGGNQGGGDNQGGEGNQGQGNQNQGGQAEGNLNVRFSESFTQSSAIVLNNSPIGASARSTQLSLSDMIKIVKKDKRNMGGLIKKMLTDSGDLMEYVNNVSKEMQLTKEETQAATDDAQADSWSDEDKGYMYLSHMSSIGEAERSNYLNKTKEIFGFGDFNANISQGGSAVENRMQELSFGNDSALPVSSGDDSKINLEGLWVSMLGSLANKGSEENSSSYRSKAVGRSIGFDFLVDEVNLVGISYSSIESVYKYRGVRFGDKNGVREKFISFYWMRNFKNGSSLKLILSEGYQKINSTRHVMESIATGSSKARSYNSILSLSLPVTVGKGWYIGSSLGVKYSYYMYGAYSESGAGVYNVSATPGIGKGIGGILGIYAVFANKISDDLSVNPLVKASVKIDSTKSEKKIRAKLFWMDEYFENEAGKGAKNKISYVLGCGFSSNYKNIDISLNYDLILQKKYRGHSGTFKIKVKL